MFVIGETLSSPAFNVVLLDEAAQSLSNEFSTFTQVETFSFHADLDLTNLHVDCLFLVGDFDQEATKQAVDFIKKSVNTFLIALQLGKDNEIFADCSVKLDDPSNAVELVKMLIQQAMMEESNENINIDIDWNDIRQTCQGFCFKFIQTECIDGENRVEQCYQQLLSALPENRQNTVFSIYVDNKFRLEELFELVDGFTTEFNDDSLVVFGVSTCLQKGIAVKALVSYQ